MDTPLNNGMTSSSSCVRRHHHSGGKYALPKVTIELPRGEELEQLYRRLASNHAIQMATDMRNLLRDKNQQPTTSGNQLPTATEEYMVRTVCEYYISLFRTLFMDSFDFNKPTSSSTSANRKEVRKNYSDSNFHSKQHKPTGITMKLDESWTKLHRKLSVDDEVFMKDASEPKKKQPQLKRWYSRVGGMKRVDDVTTTTEGCLSDSTNKSGVMTSVWNRFRRGSKSGGGCKNGHDVIKLERTSEFRISSSGNGGVIISPFLKARILLRQIGDLYQIEIYCPVKSLKPKYVIQGYDIIEARPTEASKILESRRCFVLKSNDQEFVIKLDSPDDVLVWLTEIEDANMRTPNPKPHIYECYKHPYTPEFLKKSSQQSPIQQQGGSDPSLTASKKQKKSANATTNLSLNGGVRPTACGSSTDPRWAKGSSWMKTTTKTQLNQEENNDNNSRSSSATPTTSVLDQSSKVIVGSWEMALQIFAPHQTTPQPPRPPTNAERRDSNAADDDCGSLPSPSTSTASSVVDVSVADEENTGSSGCSSSSSNGSSSGSHTTIVDMTLLPWFHGHMSRSDASSLAVQLEDGVFLLRYSANQNCHVITIAYQGKAKHLRLMIDSEGRCRVNDKTFSSVIKMLIFHHKFPIVVDASASTNASRVLLTDYVINQLKFGAGDYEYVKPQGKLTSSSGGPINFYSTHLKPEAREKISDGADVTKPATTDDVVVSRCGKNGDGEVNGGECSRERRCNVPPTTTFEERVVAQHVGKVGI